MAGKVVVVEISIRMCPDLLIDSHVVSNFQTNNGTWRNIWNRKENRRKRSILIKKN